MPFPFMAAAQMAMLAAQMLGAGGQQQAPPDPTKESPQGLTPAARLGDWMALTNQAMEMGQNLQPQAPQPPQLPGAQMAPAQTQPHTNVGLRDWWQAGQQGAFPGYGG